MPDDISKDGSYGMLSRDPDDSRVDNNAKTYFDACKAMWYGSVSFTYCSDAVPCRVTL